MRLWFSRPSLYSLSHASFPVGRIHLATLQNIVMTITRLARAGFAFICARSHGVYTRLCMAGLWYVIFQVTFCPPCVVFHFPCISSRDICAHVFGNSPSLLCSGHFPGHVFLRRETKRKDKDVDEKDMYSNPKMGWELSAPTLLDIPSNKVSWSFSVRIYFLSRLGIPFEEVCRCSIRVCNQVSERRRDTYGRRDYPGD